MPKLEEMAQLSRPFQIALVGVCLLAGVWFFALQGRSTSTGGSGSAPAATASTPAVTKASGTATKPSAANAAVIARAKAEAKSGHIYHGSVPGLEGLTRDIARAHGAVAAIGASPSNPASTGDHAAATTPASAQHAASTSASASTPTGTTTTLTHTKTPTKAVTTKTVTKAPPSSAHKTTSASATVSLSGQHAVEADLAKGDVVVLLFWNPSGTDDKSVHKAVQAVKGVKHVAVQEAAASQVASYGSITRGVQVTTTPTVLIIDKQGHALVLTGVQDTFSIEQAIGEARSTKLT
jgi:cytoskeletal protein RodZ